MKVKQKKYFKNIPFDSDFSNLIGRSTALSSADMSAPFAGAFILD